MAGTKRAIEQYIAQERKRGKSDNQIVVGLTKQKGQVGKDVDKFIRIARDNGMTPTRALGDYFGLDLTPVDANAAHKRNIGKSRSRFESALFGLADVGRGILEGVAWAGDKVNGAINDTFGTDLEDNALGKMQAEYKVAEKDLEMGRKGSGRGTGTDWVRAGTEVLATAPAFAIGGGAGVGAKGAAAFAGRQAAIGGTMGAIRHADNAAERQANIGWGAGGAAIGGVVGEKVLAPVVKKGVQAIARRAANKSGNTAQAATKLVDDALRESDIAVDAAGRDQLVKQATRALSRGREIDAKAAIRRQLLERHNIKGTQAQITRDPMMWATEREAAKHSSALNDVHIENHQQLDELMRNLVSDTGAAPVNTYEKMASTFRSLKDADDAAKTGINQLYDSAQNMAGNKATLNHMRFIDQASRELEDQGLGSFMSGDIKGIFKGMFEDPNFELTYGKAEEIIKVLNSRMRTTTDGNQRYALGLIRDNLEREIGQTADDLAASLGNGVDDSLLATKQQWDDARSAYKQRVQDIESTPALKAAIDGVEPDKAFDKYVKNANAADIVRMMDKLKKAPNGQQHVADIQGATVEHLLEQATNSNNGAFSPHALNRALKSLGDNRMKAIFTPEQIARINDIKKVADILVQQPLGAHVNHSNTANVLIKQLLGIVSLAGKIPAVGNVALGGMGALGNLAKSGAAVKMINGKVPVAKGSSMGISPDMLRMMGLAERGTQATASSAGAK